MKEGFKLSDFLDDLEDDYWVLCVHFCCAALRWSCLNCLYMFGDSQWKSVRIVVICVELYCQSKRKGKNKCWIQ